MKWASGALLLACGGSATPPSTVVEITAPPASSHVEVDASVPEAPPVTLDPLGGTRWSQDDMGLAGPTQDVGIAVSFARLRAHPEAAGLAVILAGAKPWNHIAWDTTGTRTIDPMHDIDWLRITGSFGNGTASQEFLLRYVAADAEVDAAMTLLAKNTGGGARTVHTAGVRAWKATVDGSERAILRVPHLLAVVPPGRSEDVARELPTRQAPWFHDGEVLRARLLAPQKLEQVPPDMSELRAWVDVQADGSAELLVEGDCPSAAAATADATSVRETLHRKNSFGVRLLTAGLLDHAVVGTSGAMVRLRLPASREQVAALLRLAASERGARGGL